MARIDIEKIEKKEKKINPQKFNAASYTIAKTEDNCLFQIDTYSGTEVDNHQTQTIQLDKENLPKLFNLIAENFQAFNIQMLDDSGNVKYGLNWGDRASRKNKNEAYLDLPIEIYSSKFFPINGKKFDVRTDDGQILTFSRAQSKIKGETNGHVLQTERNAEIGEYLRNRLSIPLGEPITKEDIELYGRNYITISKIGDFYFLDFSKKEKRKKSSLKIGASYSYFNQLLVAIRTKPFLILGGFSGTGKSQKVKELAYSTCPCDGVLNVSATSPGNYQLIPVKPNWHDATELTGFYSSVNRNYYVTDFMRFLVKAKQYESQKIPFFVCLDEMNLAPVEEYFADFLSIIESRKRLEDGRIVTDALVPASVFNDTSYADDFNIFMSLGLKTIEEKTVSEINTLMDEGENNLFKCQYIVNDLKKNGLTLPQNVIVIGTVNMDDTTNSFSRKVIDRAMTFETLVTKFDEADYFEKQPVLGYVENPISGPAILPDEVNAKQMIADNRFDLNSEDKSAIIGFINDVNSDLEGTPFKISYRIINETILLYRAKLKINEAFGQTEAVSLNQVFDDILMQKVLPRIEGDYDKCNACLTKLSSRASEKWSKSHEKLVFMISRLGKDHCGFTSFWN